MHDTLDTIMTPPIQQAITPADHNSDSDSDDGNITSSDKSNCFHDVPPSRSLPPTSLKPHGSHSNVENRQSSRYGPESENSIMSEATLASALRESEGYDFTWLTN
jgi:hypothetical protein